MTFQEARQKATELLSEAAPLDLQHHEPRDLVEVGRREGEGRGFLEQLQAMTPSGFPIPELLLFGLTNLIGFRSYGGVRVGFSLREESFTSMLKLFDEFDNFLREGPLRYPLRWVEAGLDVAFDSASRKKYRAAMESDEQFKDFLDWSAMDADRHANMDY